jgi:tetratricopeptide (TPR) repeat protein
MAKSRIGGFYFSHRRLATSLGAALLLAIALSVAYADTFHASWHYDDYANIVKNPNVHMARISWSALKEALSAGLHHQLIGRPLAYLSFALNYRFGALDLFGYHVVNLIIHWLAALFVFLFVRNLVALPILQGRYEKQADAIALIASLLWAVHPIQVTAVTYVVQRMTALAGLFYIMAMYFYLKGHKAFGSVRRFSNFSLCAVAALCALLSKENAIVLIYALWLLDLMLIQGMDRTTLRRNLVIVAGLTLVVVLSAFVYTHPATMFKPYAQRPFTRFERLLTEPRVLFDYLSLLVMPMTSHMAIVHDIVISHALTQPWITSWAIAGLLAIVIGLGLAARKYPLFSFCGLFFFMNHAVEASFLNLELMYEHRNYIPSMLLFVLLGVAVVKSLARFGDRRMFQGMIIGCLLVVTASQLQTTISYNKLFRSEVATWSHVVITYPAFSLGYMNLGKVYWDAGLFERARQQFETALEKDRYNNLYQKGMVYFDLGMYEALKKNDRAKALSLFGKAMAIYPDSQIMQQVSLNHLKLGQWQAAIDGADEILDKVPGDTEALMIKAQALRKLNRRVSALQILEHLQPRDKGDQSIVLLAMVEIYAELGQPADTDRCITDFLDHNHGKSIKTATFAVEAPEALVYVPDARLLQQVFTAYIQRQGKAE